MNTQRKPGEFELDMDSEGLRTLISPIKDLICSECKCDETEQWFYCPGRHEVWCRLCTVYIPSSHHRAREWEHTHFLIDKVKVVNDDATD